MLCAANAAQAAGCRLPCCASLGEATASISKPFTARPAFQLYARPQAPPTPHLRPCAPTQACPAARHAQVFCTLCFLTSWHTIPCGTPTLTPTCRALKSKASSERYHLGSSVSKVEVDEGRGVALTLEGGQRYEGDLLIGADG